MQPRTERKRKCTLVQMKPNKIYPIPMPQSMYTLTQQCKYSIKLSQVNRRSMVNADEPLILNPLKHVCHKLPAPTATFCPN